MYFREYVHCETGLTVTLPQIPLHYPFAEFGKCPADLGRSVFSPEVLLLIFSRLKKMFLLTETFLVATFNKFTILYMMFIE